MSNGTNIVHFPTERDRRNGPDADCIIADADGRPMHLFAIDWRHAGRTWTVQICAYDHADAEARVQSMRASAEVVGQVVAQGRAPWI